MRTTAEKVPVLCVAVTPCLQRILRISGFRTGGVNRARLATLTVGGKAVNTARALSALGDVPLLTGLAGGTHGSVMRSILDRMGVTHDFARSRGETRICTTLFDESRAAFLFGGGEGWRLFPPTVKALNSVGSGDSCTAGIVHALLRGREMPEAARFGLACGAANAETLEPGEISPAAARRVVGGVGLRRAP